MVRGGAIEGVVTDASGDPVWNVVVTALQPQPDGAKPKSAAETKTDDLGRYRLHSLAAGEYAVQVATDRTYVGTLFLMPGEKRPEINTAFYPAAATIEDARLVRVSAGRDATGTDVTFSPAAPAKDPAAPPAPPRPDLTGTGRIAGTVTDATSGKPVKAAELLLLPAAGQGQRITNWTRTDAQGRFEYKGLTAQRYTLRFLAQRFVTLEYGQKRPGEAGTQIQLRDGEDYRADMKLPRAAAIEGMLLDEFGEPAPSVLVQAAQKQYVAGRHRLMPIPSRIPTAPTDDRGHYRISNVAPGDYYVAALSGAYTDANEVGGFAPTYYPGTTDASAATTVTVAFGADSTGTTFPLAPAKTLMVRGTMVDSTGKPVAGRGTLWLATPDRLKRMDFNLARGVTAPDGSFVLRNVPQGQYTLQGFAPPPPGYRGPGNLAAMEFGSQPLTVGDADLDGVALKTSPGAVLRGRFVLDESGGPPLAANQVSVSAMPIEFDSSPIGGGPPPSTMNDDMTFEVRRLYGTGRVVVDTRAPTLALKKIVLNDKDITDTPIDFSKDVEGVEVVLTSKVSRVTGSVSDDKGPVTDFAVLVFASDPTKWIDRSRFVAVARPTQEGRFTLAGLPAEDYLAVALPSITGTEFMDPDFLQQLRVQATSFTLIDGDVRTLELKLKKRP
jgi:5-hydroxyisourate hydrolase-like protein (transthyretin family)